MSNEEEQVVGEVAGDAARGASSGARVVVALALMGCWLTVLAPISAIVAALAVGGLVMLAALVQLHTGGFELEPFTVCVWLALACAVLWVLGSWVKPAEKAPAEGADQLRPSSSRGLLSLLGVTSVVTYAEWDGNAWLPDPLSSFLVLSCLLLLAIVVPLALLWGGVRLALALYRWSRASAFVAGMVTVLAGLLAAGSVATCGAEPSGSQPSWEDRVRARTAQQVLGTALEAEGFSDTMRALLMATAEALDPHGFQERTTQAIRASRPKTAPVQPLPLPPAPPASDPAVNACLDELLERASTNVATVFDPFVQRVRESNPFLPQDELKALVVDTMLEVCLAHDRATFESLRAIFLTKLEQRATDRSRRERKSCEILPQYAACQLASAAWMRDPELDALHDMLCGLKENERMIMALRVLMGYRFAEIGAALQIGEDKAREIFNNTRRRLKRQLEARCDASPWGGY